MNHKRRIDRLASQIPGGGDDDIIVIRLTWGGEEDPARPPIVCRRGRDGRLVKVDADAVPAHLAGPAVNITTHWDDIEIIE
jgi:hypothetical protein